MKTVNTKLKTTDKHIQFYKKSENVSHLVKAHRATKKKVKRKERR